MSIASLLSPDRLIQISPIFRTAIASFGLALSLLIVSGAPAQANSHTANQSEMSEFAKAVKAIKDKQFQDGLTRFIALAEAGDPEAQYNVAVLLHSGRGRPQNYSDALFWALLSQLGTIEQAEDRMTENDIQSVLERVKAWLIRRVNDGYLETIPQLATYHLELLEEQDYETAYLWYTLATALNIPETIKLRDEAEEELEPEQISALQAQTNSLFDQIIAGEPIMESEQINEN
ncbi:MAG: hypothetical protein ACPHCX_06430 [Candidatus Puniceispirillaceae bacterium]